MEKEQTLMQSAVNDNFKDIDRKCLRTLQIQMHECAIKCYKDSNNTETLEKCTEKCSKKVLAARDYVYNEFDKWQQRAHRCVQDCGNVSGRLPYPRDPSYESEMHRYVKEGEACASQCVAKHIKMLPQLSSKIIDYLSRYNK